MSCVPAVCLLFWSSMLLAGYLYLGSVRREILHFNALKTGLLIRPSGAVKDYCKSHLFKPRVAGPCQVTLRWRSPEDGWHQVCSGIKKKTFSGRYYQISLVCHLGERTLWRVTHLMFR